MLQCLSRTVVDQICTYFEAEETAGAIVIRVPRGSYNTHGGGSEWHVVARKGLDNNRIRRLLRRLCGLTRAMVLSEIQQMEPVMREGDYVPSRAALNQLAIMYNTGLAWYKDTVDFPSVEPFLYDISNPLDLTNQIIDAWISSVCRVVSVDFNTLISCVKQQISAAGKWGNRDLQMSFVSELTAMQLTLPTDLLKKHPPSSARISRAWGRSTGQPPRAQAAPTPAGRDQPGAPS